MTPAGPLFVKERIAAILNLFPSVRWDTVIDEHGEVDVLGWIERERGWEDWIVLLFVKQPPRLLGFLSSRTAPEPSGPLPDREGDEKLSEFLVEEYFGDLVRNRIHVPAMR